MKNKNPAFMKEIRNTLATMQGIVREEIKENGPNKANTQQQVYHLLEVMEDTFETMNFRPDSLISMDILEGQLHETIESLTILHNIVKDYELSRTAVA